MNRRPENANEDYGTVILPAEPRFLEMAQRVLEEVPSAQLEPLVIRDPRDGSTSIRGPRDDAGLVPLGSTGELAMITDTSGRSAPADLVAAAKRYIQVSGSAIRPFELALAAAYDNQLRSKLLAYLVHNESGRAGAV